MKLKSEKKIKISFFETETSHGFDVNAVEGGVYMFELSMDGNNESICLYIGESGEMAKRCGEHLYNLFQTPEYFGLEEADLMRQDFTIKIRIVTPMKEKKFLWDKTYKNTEKEAIKKYKPLTQFSTSDKQIPNRKEVVQKRMVELGFKN